MRKNTIYFTYFIIFLTTAVVFLFIGIIHERNRSNKEIEYWINYSKKLEKSIRFLNNDPDAYEETFDITIKSTLERDTIRDTIEYGRLQKN